MVVMTVRIQRRNRLEVRIVGLLEVMKQERILLKITEGEKKERLTVWLVLHGSFISDHQR